jgi:hypothetical protein
MIQGMPGVDIKGNTNLTLGAPLTYGNVDYVSLTDNSFASPPTLTIGNELIARDPNTTNAGLVSIERNSGLSLGGITIGSIAGDLTIADNHGFSNADALSFANALSVAGTLSISGNTP